MFLAKTSVKSVLYQRMYVIDCISVYIKMLWTSHAFLINSFLFWTFKCNVYVQSTYCILVLFNLLSLSVVILPSLPRLGCLPVFYEVVTYQVNTIWFVKIRFEWAELLASHLLSVLDAGHCSDYFSILGMGSIWQDDLE